MAALRIILFILTVAGLVVPASAHTPRGNVTSNGITFTCDPGSGSGACFTNQPTSLTGIGTATFSYDANFKRVKEVRSSKTIYTVYSRLTGGLVYRDEMTDQLRTDYASVAGAAVRLVRIGTGSATPTYTHFDAQGTGLTGTSASGAIDWREA
jgi:hypothetical protein